MKAVISIGGSVLLPDFEDSRIEGYADVLRSLTDDGIELGAVVGGGPIARRYIEAARQAGDNEIALDYLGIAVTRINARVLIAALGSVAHREPATDYREAHAALQTSDVCVMGGAAPAQTTDAVGAALAEYIDADLLVLATSVDGVYDRDPREEPSARRFDALSPAALAEVVGDIELEAGSSAPVDILATKIIERSSMRTIVLDGTEPTAVERAVRTGVHDGTDIQPSAGADDPTFWERS